MPDQLDLFAVSGHTPTDSMPARRPDVDDAPPSPPDEPPLRAPPRDGHGNFGSLDGDGAAAYRYTECKLTPVAMELLEELRKNTVATRPTFDGSLQEPIVLPARFPNALVNGATGIAVGMATNIPPHNLTEVVDALVALIDHRDLEVKQLLKYVRGPDFPTGVQILNNRNELREI